MRVCEVMSASVHAVGPSSTIRDAATAMADYDVGALPVVAGRTLAGIITDRDITVRAVARSIDLGAPVSTIMTPQVATSSPQDSVENALRMMLLEKVRRLPVCNAEGEPIGMVTLADIGRHKLAEGKIAEALEKISEPSSTHCQTLLAGEPQSVG
jgi:CBS-domain-containing membrane protein